MGFFWKISTHLNLFSMPPRGLETVYVKCSMPAKVDLSTRLVQEEAGKYLVVNPDTSRVIANQ